MENQIIGTGIEIAKSGVFENIITLFSNSGFTAVLIAITSILVTGVISFKRDKRSDHQQIVRQILPERMKAHSAILEITINVSQKLLKILFEPPTERPNLIMKYSDELRQVYEKNTLWLNKGIDDLFWGMASYLSNEALSDNKEKLLKIEINNTELLKIMETYAKYRGNIQNRMRLLSGFPLLDKTLGDMAVEPKKKGFFSRFRR